MRIINRIDNNCIQANSSLIDALNGLEAANPKILFVIDDEGRLIASVTDGDVRRAILSGVGLDICIDKVASNSPRVICRGETSDVATLALKIMRQYGITAIPIVDSERHIIEIITNDDNKEERSRISVPVVIMAGGKGTRLYPYTKILPKPLIPIEDIPISERIMNMVYDSGCTDFHMIVNYKKDMIKAYYGESNREYDIRFHDEVVPLGTGGGLKLVENAINNTFILTNCDILILEDIARILMHHREKGNKATIVCSLKNFEIPYGVVNFTEGGDVASFDEKPKMSFFTNTGYYILEKDVFSYISDNESIGMPDILTRMKDAGLKIGVYPIGENTWLDMGQFDSMESMERKLNELNI